ncbi:DUF6445 family protein [Alteraurantiacibacter aquimixticola]|uniref:Uncharacterized protein n=1 Tax=Alteraurantiacibacter aquimixticola TaxID=2489173 RepID=A0A4T3F384_9SPHN|nr:DUF6445 family protein [Alteraurantiacibacter aquimixticola]TIX51725.1 hypothetical protein E5222_04550 [Alteraurantiacibacter aquimixticola]
MSQSPLALSPTYGLTVSHFGEEAQPLLQVDGALADLALVRKIAARHSYRSIGPFYPGLRAPVSAKIAMPLVEPLLPKMCETFGLEREPAYFECYLSLVTKAPGELAPIQRLPHFDGTEPERLAVLLFLSDDSACGTAFYRQCSTGYESVDGSRYDCYLAELEAATAQHGIPPASYIGADSPIFTRTLRVAGAANRMIAYRGNTLHCAALRDDFTPDADPRSGRLTLNLFLKA